MKAVARAHPNIALIKYWGKRDERLNLPFTDSLSVTLDGLATTMRVQFVAALANDVLTINGLRASPEATRRVTEFLNRLRVMAGTTLSARVESTSDVPVAAGLASSAAAFAALSLASARALHLEAELDGQALSRVARQGSGSAARSVFGGFVHWAAGIQDDGRDSVARVLYGPDWWPITLLVVIASAAVKALSSREAMRRTVETSPLYDAFRQSTPTYLATVQSALRERRWDTLGPTVEAHALTMHATALTARPSIRFWNSATIRVMDTVEQWRREGRVAYYTMDAGPNVVVLCPNAEADGMAHRIQGVAGVQQVIACHPGPGPD